MQALGNVDGFEKLPADMIESAPRFKEWFNHVTSESEKLPLDWRDLEKQPFRKLLVVRCLRPDRMTNALTRFIRSIVPCGKDFTECDGQLNSYQVLQETFADSTNTTPIFFILSPGADPQSDIQLLCDEKGFTAKFRFIALGQGQGPKAEELIEQGTAKGHWVLLQNCAAAAPPGRAAARFQ